MILALFLIGVWMPVTAIVRAAAVQLGWEWFIAPVFTGLPGTLSFAEALGLSLFLALFTVDFVGADADDAANKHKSAGEKALTTCVRGVLFYAFYFLLAVIVHALGAGS